jgi:hypothetical protein
MTRIGGNWSTWSLRIWAVTGSLIEVDVSNHHSLVGKDESVALTIWEITTTNMSPVTLFQQS